MKEWIKKTQNIIFSAICTISAIMSIVGIIKLLGLLEKGFSVFSVKASIIRLVIDILLTISCPLLVLISYRIKWMYETRLLHDSHAKELEAMSNLCQELKLELSEMRGILNERQR